MGVSHVDGSLVHVVHACHVGRVRRRGDHRAVWPGHGSSKCKSWGDVIEQVALQCLVRLVVVVMVVVVMARES